jgi:hypothetical protein
MIHIRTHLSDGLRGEHLLPDFYVVENMVDRNLITSEDLAFALEYINIRDELELLPSRWLDTKPLFVNYWARVQHIQELIAKLEVGPTRMR